MPSRKSSAESPSTKCPVSLAASGARSHAMQPNQRLHHRPFARIHDGIDHAIVTPKECCPLSGTPPPWNDCVDGATLLRVIDFDRMRRQRRSRWIAGRHGRARRRGRGARGRGERARLRDVESAERGLGMRRVHAQRSDMPAQRMLQWILLRYRQTRLPPAADAGGMRRRSCPIIP